MTINLSSSIFYGFSRSWVRIFEIKEDDIYDMLLSDGYEGEDFRNALNNAIDWKNFYNSISSEIVKSISKTIEIPLEFEELLPNRWMEEQIVLSFDPELLKKRISELSEVQIKDFEMYSTNLSVEYKKYAPYPIENVDQLKAHIDFTALCLTLYSEDGNEDPQQSINIGGIMHSCIRLEEIKKYAPKAEYKESHWWEFTDKSTPNTLLVGSTGTGKTYEAIHKKGTFMYLAPCRQLVYEVFMDYGDSENDSIHTGEFHNDPKDSQNMFAVYESSRSHDISKFDYIIIDEFHFVGDPERNDTLLELLQQARKENIPVIGATATNTLSSDVLDQLGFKVQELSQRFAVPTKVQQSKEDFYKRLNAGQPSIYFSSRIPDDWDLRSICETAKIDMSRARIISSATLSYDRVEAQKMFKNREIDLVVCTNVLAQGLNFPASNVFIEYNSWDTEEILEQKIGRLGRPNMCDDKEVYYTLHKSQEDIKIKQKNNISKNKSQVVNKAYPYVDGKTSQDYLSFEIPKSLKSYSGFKYSYNFLETELKAGKIGEKFAEKAQEALAILKQDRQKLATILL